MAKNTKKRVATKHIRDGIKSNYKKDCKCAVCDTSEDLELHHAHTVSLLLERYCTERQIPVDTDEQVLAMRDKFYEVHWYELVEDTITLCNTHHKLLHSVYGKQPSLSTAKKQHVWVQRIKEKLSGKESQPIDLGGRFSQFIQGDTANRFSKLI